MEKVIRDGKVAVLYSPRYGAGWYSWHCEEPLLFHPTIVALVEQGRHDEITEDLCKYLLGKAQEDYICTLGAEDLQIEWVEQGTALEIEEHDGAESVRIIGEIQAIVA